MAALTGLLENLSQGSRWASRLADSGRPMIVLVASRGPCVATGTAGTRKLHRINPRARRWKLLLHLAQRGTAEALGARLREVATTTLLRETTLPFIILALPPRLRLAPWSPDPRPPVHNKAQGSAVGGLGRRCWMQTHRCIEHLWNRRMMAWARTTAEA
jgi:hypothetical protein